MELSFKKLFNSNSKKTMEILADFGNYEKFFPYIKECRIITRENNYIKTLLVKDCQLTYYLPLKKEHRIFCIVLLKPCLHQYLVQVPQF